MQVQLYSDVHNEILRSARYEGSHPFKISNASSDLVVVAGDYDTGTYGVERLKQESIRLNKPILYALGNHEFYDNEYHSLKKELKSLCEGSNVYILDRNVYEFNSEVRFLGCTLWTNYVLEGFHSHDIRYYIERGLRDHQVIEIESQGKCNKFLTSDALTLHNTELNWLKKQLSKDYPGKTVVITHHAPHPVCQHPDFTVNEISAAFHSDLSAVIENNNIDVWMFGHTHANIDTVINGTRIISNQLGYPEEGVPGFDYNLVIDI